MSHILTYVLVPAGTRNIPERVHEMMSPYDENVPVQPYEWFRPCVVASALSKALAATNAKLGASSSASRQWKVFLRECHTQLLLTEPADSECPICSGTGKIESTLNPDGKWDWYQILTSPTEGDGAPNTICCDLEFDSVDAHLKNPVVEELELPTSILTTDGVWHDPEIWWTSDWDAASKTLLEKHQDAILVPVDCHTSG